MQGINLSLIYRIWTLCFLPLIAAGQAGTAIYFQNEVFNSHGDFIYCGQPSYTFSDQLSVAAWVKWTVDPGTYARSNHAEREGSYSTYIAYATHNASNTSDEEGLFWLRNTKTGNQITFTVENTSGTQVTVTSSTKPASGVWYYITGTYDGTNVKLYVNGTLEATGSLTGTVRSNTDCRLTMGRLPWGYGFFAGYMEEVRVWNTALTSTEVNTQKNSSATVQSSKCLSYWNFNAGSGTSISDAQGRANGTFYSALIDVHGASDFANKIIDDPDRAFVTGAWNGKSMHTVAGAGVDEINIIVSNTGNLFTLTYGFGGSAPDNRTTPVIDGNPNMTWFGVVDETESGQWVESTADISLAVELTDFEAEALAQGVMLYWKTESEFENLGYLLERKQLGTDWVAVADYRTEAALDGQGSSNQPHSYQYLDKLVLSAGKYLYRLSDVDYQGRITQHPEIQVNVPEAKVQLPRQGRLTRLYPNPFNPSLNIEYSIENQAHVRLQVYNLSGELVVMLIDQQQQVGLHQICWEPKQLDSGIYLLQFQTADVLQNLKVLYIK